MVSRVIMLAAAIMVAATEAQAQDILRTSFAGTAPGQNTPWTATSFLAPGLGYSGLVRGPSTNGTAVNDAFGFNVNGPASNPSSLAEAIADGEYVGFTLTPGATPLDLGGKEVVFSIQRESWHAPRQYSVLTNVGGFVDGAELTTTPYASSDNFANTTFRFFMPVSGYDDLATPIEFRLYAYGAQYNHNTRLTQFDILGHAGPVHTLALGPTTGGTISASPAQSLFADGATVSITATPQAGHHFVGWSGDVTGRGNPLTLTMTRDYALAASFAPNPAPQMSVGTNLGGVKDWSTDWPFVDIFAKTRSWLARPVNNNSVWDSGLAYRAPLDANGWPTQVPFDPATGDPLQILHTYSAAVPIAGTYTLLWEGTGAFRIDTNQTAPLNLAATGGAQSATYAIPAGAQLYIVIDSTNTADPIRNIRLITPGFESSWQTQVFHPLFMERLEPFSCLRFMDWGATNASPLATWDQRTLPTSYTQTRTGGVSLERMVELANRLDRDPWFCVPHRADDNYVRQMARLLRDTVEPNRRIYVEYSNETWNSAGAFTQTVYVQDQGQALGLRPTRWDAGQYYAALRTVQIQEIFEEEFGSAAPSRLATVIGTQSANISITQTRLNALNDPAINPRRTMPQVLAIAPYFGCNFDPAWITQNGYPTVDQVVTTMSTSTIASAQANVRAQKALADAQGMELVCYEGGQHFIGTQGGENDTTLINILTAANRDPRMETRYLEYLDMLEAEGVVLFVNFSYVSAPSKWGAWGVLEYQDQPEAQAPKYRALIQWISSQAPASDRVSVF